MDGSTPSLSPSGTSPSSTIDAPYIPVQPAFFYPNGYNSKIQVNLDGEEFLSPDQDPLATRGIPVFKPTMDEFHDFEKYMQRVEIWGRRSGIVKVIPPKEWSDALPPVNDQLPNLKLKSPIEQHMIGRAGLFRQTNIEKRKILNLREWAELCNKDNMRAPPIKDGSVRTRGIARPSTRPPARPRRKGKSKVEQAVEVEVEDPSSDSLQESAESKPDDANDNFVGQSSVQSVAASDHQVNGLPLDITSSNDPVAPLQPPRDDKDVQFYSQFDPFSSWTPEDTRPEDYTPEACHELERLFWRTCGLGVPALYGADMAGSLFTEKTTEWNVAHLPSFLSRLGSITSLPGVNTPYLYFGMWRATFAWHVEDMDLYSINYIHWGAPKHWYAIPNERSKAFEGVMRGFFPGDPCPQFLRHKSYLASPTLLSQSNCRPNLLVQHQGEFVITYPRGYHAGFNLGLNCAESVNFALDSWVELGRKAGVCQCVGDSVRIDVDALLNDAERKRDEERLEVVDKKRKLEDDTNVPAISSLEPITHPAPKRLKIIQAYGSAMISEDAETTSFSQPFDEVPRPKPRIRLSTTPIIPCCLCASPDRRGLLRLHESCLENGHVRSAAEKDGRVVEKWEAHEQCARIVPETWIDEVDGEKMVFGVDSIVKDRWNLKCSVCSRNVLKGHGAKVQCTKGKCPKAFHVSCAIAAEDVSFGELEEVEKEVLIVDHSPGRKSKQAAETAFLSEMVEDEWEVPGEVETDSKAVKTIRKPVIELLCSQHNPAVQERKKAAKMEQIKRDVLSLTPESRVRIRNQSGVYEVTLVSIHEDRGSIVVIWGDGERKEFKWSSIVWGLVPEGTVVRQAEYEMGPVRTSRAAGTNTSTHVSSQSSSKAPPSSRPSQSSMPLVQTTPAPIPTARPNIQPPYPGTYQYPYGYLHPSHPGGASYYPPAIPPHVQQYYPPPQGHPQYRGYINQRASPHSPFYYYPPPQTAQPPATATAPVVHMSQTPRSSMQPPPTFSSSSGGPQSGVTVPPPPPNAYIFNAVPAYPPSYYHPGYGYGYPIQPQYSPYTAYPNTIPQHQTVLGHATHIRQHPTPSISSQTNNIPVPPQVGSHVTAQHEERNRGQA